MPIQRKRKSTANPADASAAGAPESILNLTDLKNRSMQDLMELAEQYQVETASSMRKQELIFAILQACASQRRCAGNSPRRVRLSPFTSQQLYARP